MQKTTDRTGVKGTWGWRVILTLWGATMLWTGGMGLHCRRRHR